MRSVYTFIIGISLIINLTGCENCGPSAEPLLHLFYRTNPRPVAVSQP